MEPKKTKTKQKNIYIYQDYGNEISLYELKSGWRKMYIMSEDTAVVGIFLTINF